MIEPNNHFKCSAGPHNTWVKLEQSPAPLINCCCMCSDCICWPASYSSSEINMPKASKVTFSNSRRSRTSYQCLLDLQHHSDQATRSSLSVMDPWGRQTDDTLTPCELGDTPSSQPAKISCFKTSTSAFTTSSQQCECEWVWKRDVLEYEPQLWPQL